MTQSHSFYKQVVHISSSYLGPAADRFISKQVTYHLQKRPEDLQPEDLPELIGWIRLAVSFLTEDQSTVNEYNNKLQALLTNSKSPKQRSSRTSRLYPAKKFKRRINDHAASS